jgi:regulator of protease activity HflC (stomatin/prohibitin superfamily)
MFHILREDERIAVFRRGRYRGLKGPGIVIVFPPAGQWVKLRVGDTGQLITIDLARFDTFNVPITGENINTSPVRITDFADELQPPRPRVMSVTL